MTFVKVGPVFIRPLAFLKKLYVSNSEIYTAGSIFFFNARETVQESTAAPAPDL